MTEGQRVILTHLAERGPLKRYDFKTRFGLSYSHVHSNFKWLESQNLVKVHKTEVSPKTKKSTSHFGLTLLGLHVWFYCMSRSRFKTATLLDKLHSAVSNYPELFPVFGKWSYFEEEDKSLTDWYQWSKDKLIEENNSLVKIANDSLLEVFGEDRQILEEAELSHKLAAEFLTKGVLRRTKKPLVNRDSFDKKVVRIAVGLSGPDISWMWIVSRMIEQDKELRGAFIEELRQRAFEHHIIAHVLTSFLSYLKEPESPWKVEDGKIMQHSVAIMPQWDVPEILQKGGVS